MRGPFEGQRAGRLVRCRRRVPACFAAIARAMEVDGEPFRVRPLGSFQHSRQTAVAASQTFGREVSANRFANTIVIGLNFLALGRHPRAHQAAAAQGCHHFVIGALVLRGLLCQFELNRLPGDRDHLQQLARRLRKARDARLNYLVQRGCPAGRFRRPHQLADE